MFFLWKLAFYLFTIQICGLAFIKYWNLRNRNLETNIEESDSLLLTEPEPEPFNISKYRFDSPKLAYEILSQLDIYEPINKTYFITYDNTLVRYKVPFLGTTDNDLYCELHRDYFVKYPQKVFEEANIFVELAPSTLFRRFIVPTIGKDIMPHVGHHMNQTLQKNKTIEIRSDISIFATSLALNEFKDAGKHFSCISQMSNHIPGHLVLNRKDSVAKAAIKYVKDYQDRPQCFSNEKLFPETFFLSEKEDCKAFFEVLNSSEYQKLKKERHIVYIRKVAVGKHRGEGVQVVNDEEEASLREIYSNGNNCSKIKNYYIIQKYIHNPLLLNGNKFDFRMYMLFASSNPIMAYYHDGFLRVSLTTYNVTSKDKNSHLTNLALTKSMYQEVKDGKAPDMDEEALRYAQQWTMERLQEYLLEKGKITDPNWLDNYLRPEFKKAMAHLAKMSSPYFFRGSSMYELYGVDFMLDDDLNLWFIEANSGPAFGEYTPSVKKVVTGMLIDHFRIAIGLLRSRVKRVIDYVNMLTTDGYVIALEDGEVVIPDLEERIKEFKKITENSFEREFEPEPDNGFVKIMDEHYEGVERYMGIIDETCL